jgi:hypothetical protein
MRSAHVPETCILTPGRPGDPGALSQGRTLRFSTKIELVRPKYRTTTKRILRLSQDLAIRNNCVSLEV